MAHDRFEDVCRGEFVPLVVQSSPGCAAKGTARAGDEDLHQILGKMSARSSPIRVAESLPASRTSA